MIKRLVIHRFRGIKQGTLEDFGKINVLIGPNNSGKTAILEMLYLASVADRECEILIPDVEPSAWQATTLNKRDFLYQEPMLRLRKRHNEPKVWESSPAVLTDEYTLRVELTHIPQKYPLKKFTLVGPPEEGGRKPAFGKRDVTHISLFRLSPNSISVPESLIPDYFDAQKVTLENAYWVYLWEDSWVYRWDKEKPADYFAIWAVEGQLPEAEHVLFFDLHTATELFEQKFSKSAYHEITNWENYVSEHLGNVFPEMRGAKVNMKPYKGNKWTGYIEFPDREPIPIDHFGDGARHAFKVLATLIALQKRASSENKPGLFLWEDPELFMHPSTLGRLLEEVIELVKDVPIQVFLITQSLEVIAWLAHLVTQKNEEQKSLSKIYYLNLKEGQLNSCIFEIDSALSWLKGGLDLREIETGLVEEFPLTWTFRSYEKGEAPW